MSVYRDFEHVDRFTTGAVGRPGARTFFLHLADSEATVTIKCEKEQVAALAAFLRRTLDDAPAVTERIDAPGPAGDPLDTAFVLGSIGLAYDRREDRVVLQFEELSPDDDEEDADTGRVRVRVTRAQAVAFCETAERIVRAGRPPCIYCGLPVDSDGHACPRMN